MRRLIFLPALLGACANDDSAADAGPDSGIVDGGTFDRGVPNPDGNGESLQGTDEFDVRVVSGPFGNPTSPTDKGAGVAGAAIRVETSDGSSFLDVTADSNGNAKLLLDGTKGPFNITAAMAGTGAGSVMGVSSNADLGGRAIWLPQPPSAPQFVVTGTIANLVNPTDSVQIGGADFHSLWLQYGSTTLASYTSTETYVAADLSNVNLAALDLDGTKGCFGGPCLLAGVWTPDLARQNAPMTVNVDFSQSPQTPVKGTVTVNLPNSGMLPAANVTAVGNLMGGQGAAWSNSSVVKIVGQSTAFVGAALLGLPASGAAPFRFQAFATGSLQPDYGVASFGDMAGSRLSVSIKSFIDGATTSAPALAKLLFSSNGMGQPTAMDDAQLDFDATGADFTTVVIREVNPSSSNGIFWFLYEPRNTGTALHLPHLPSPVSLSDLTQASNVTIEVTAAKGTKPSDFASSVGGTVNDWAYSYEVQVAATGR